MSPKLNISVHLFLKTKVYNCIALIKQQTLPFDQISKLHLDKQQGSQNGVQPGNRRSSYPSLSCWWYINLFWWYVESDVASAPSVDYTFKPSALFKLTSKELLLLQHGTTWVGIWVCDVFCCC